MSGSRVLRRVWSEVRVRVAASRGTMHGDQSTQWHLVCNMRMTRIQQGPCCFRNILPIWSPCPHSVPEWKSEAVNTEIYCLAELNKQHACRTPCRQLLPLA